MVENVIQIKGEIMINADVSIKIQKSSYIQKIFLNIF